MVEMDRHNGVGASTDERYVAEIDGLGGLIPE